MPGVLELQLGVGVHALGAGGRHVDEVRRLDRPFAPSRSKRIGADSTPRNFPIRPESAAIGPPAAPLAIAVDRVALLGVGTLVGDEADRPVPLPISSGVKPRTMKPRPSSETAP